MRYYLEHSGGLQPRKADGSVDNTPRQTYRLEVARDAVRRGGGKQIRTARQDEVTL